ncbi:MAG TPA: helix-turn-helix transcriptional regulator [Vicinamibacterales bacterium]|nr:helix-turn-helix transcriptional regulator [Vicinamibacterales bacterium]
MSDRETFGPRLRRERERRGISLETLASVTNVGVELWEGLERNDFSRWPRGIFARAFIRDYARAIGMDAEELVEEFCRLFPVGDRRAAPTIREQAEIIGHDPAYRDEPGLIPGGVDRRTAHAREDSAPTESVLRARLAPRLLTAATDGMLVIGAAVLMSALTPVPFWTGLALTGVVYHAAGTILVGSTPGQLLTDLLRDRVPALFAVPNRRAHA